MVARLRLRRERDVSQTPEPAETLGADERGLLAHRSTFLVRVRRDASGAVTGVVEVARTGEKRRFVGTGSIGQLIDVLLAASGADRRHSDGSGLKTGQGEVP